MTLKEFNKEYKSKMSLKQKTKHFNQLSVNERRVFLKTLSESEKKNFISKIRTQAVKDFWTHEQALIKDGKCTRPWTPEQIEDILNISEKTGVMSINGDSAVDINGKSYYGHHMLSVTENPEYAGDWRNVQALDYDEHYFGAHEGNTKIPTNEYYNPDTGVKSAVDLSKLENVADVKTGEGYIPTQECIFKPEKDIQTLYSKYGSINDGESLALKNIELSKTPKGTISDFNRGLDVAGRYKCKDFKDKFKIKISPHLKDKALNTKKSMLDWKKDIRKEAAKPVGKTLTPKVKMRAPKMDLVR